MKKSSIVSLVINFGLLVLWVVGILLFMGFVRDDDGNLPKNYLIGLFAGFVPFIAGIVFSVVYRPVYNDTVTENTMVPFIFMGLYLLVATIFNAVFTFLPGEMLYIAVVLVNLVLLAIFAGVTFGYNEYRNRLLKQLAADARRKNR